MDNKKGLRNYNIDDTLEAGVVLTGAETKSVRDGRLNLSNSYVKVVGHELWLINADIAKYRFSSEEKYDSTRTRKLLVHKRELVHLLTKAKGGGRTIIPIKAYFSRGRVKILIGIGKGRKVFEKRAVEKEKQQLRELHKEKRKYMV